MNCYMEKTLKTSLTHSERYVGACWRMVIMTAIRDTDVDGNDDFVVGLRIQNTVLL